MSNLVTFSQANLPAVSTLSTALRKLDAAVGPAGVAILKMDKTGHWVFGSDQTEVEDDAVWAINPFSFVHGFIAWGGTNTAAAGTVLGETMAGVTEPLPEVGPAPELATNGWQKQVGLSLKCTNGEDEGLECRFCTISVGGIKAVQTLAVAIANQVEKDPNKPVAIVRLKKTHYLHKSYGKIYTPIFEVVDWMSMDGKAEEAPAEEAAEEAAPATVNAAAGGRRRRAA